MCIEKSDVQSTGYILAGESYEYDRYGNQTGKVDIKGYTSRFRGSYDSEGNLNSATVFMTDDGARTANISCM